MNKIYNKIKNKENKTQNEKIFMNLYLTYINLFVLIEPKGEASKLFNKDFKNNSLNNINKMNYKLSEYIKTLQYDYAVEKLIT